MLRYGYTMFEVVPKGHSLPYSISKIYFDIGYSVEGNLIAILVYMDVVSLRLHCRHWALYDEGSEPAVPTSPSQLAEAIALLLRRDPPCDPQLDCLYLIDGLYALTVCTPLRWC